MNFLRKSLLLFVALAAFSLPVAADNHGKQNIVAVASGNADFSTLVAAIKAADLVDALPAAVPYTVFAPTNAASAALPAGTLPIGIELAANCPLDVGGQRLLALNLVRVVRVHRSQQLHERFPQRRTRLAPEAITLGDQGRRPLEKWPQGPLLGEQRCKRRRYRARHGHLYGQFNGHRQ